MQVVQPFSDSKMTLFDFLEYKEKESLDRAVKEIPEPPEITDIEEEHFEQLLG